LRLERCPATPSFLLLLEECGVATSSIQIWHVQARHDTVAFWQQASCSFPHVRELRVLNSNTPEGIVQFLMALQHPVVAIVDLPRYDNVAALLPASATHVTLRKY
jgi:hypothetical protein